VALVNSNPAMPITQGIQTATSLRLLSFIVPHFSLFRGRSGRSEELRKATGITRKMFLLPFQSPSIIANSLVRSSAVLAAANTCALPFLARTELFEYV
jgi:hypothetical protein